ncbi:MAG: hypothetical protein GXN92_00540 [Candidatus Micrarchaeota archaeon]|nr:hypothetical protein [Candidatus Micrarchaeota archaeon]
MRAQLLKKQYRFLSPEDLEKYVKEIPPRYLRSWGRPHVAYVLGEMFSGEWKGNPAPYWKALYNYFSLHKTSQKVREIIKNPELWIEHLKPKQVVALYELLPPQERREAWGKTVLYLMERNLSLTPYGAGDLPEAWIAAFTHYPQYLGELWGKLKEVQLTRVELKTILRSLHPEATPLFQQFLKEKLSMEDIKKVLDGEIIVFRYLIENPAQWFPFIEEYYPEAYNMEIGKVKNFFHYALLHAPESYLEALPAYIPVSRLDQMIRKIDGEKVEGLEPHQRRAYFLLKRLPKRAVEILPKHFSVEDIKEVLEKLFERGINPEHFPYYEQLMKKIGYYPPWAALYGGEGEVPVKIFLSRVLDEERYKQLLEKTDIEELVSHPEVASMVWKHPPLFSAIYPYMLKLSKESAEKLRKHYSPAYFNIGKALSWMLQYWEPAEIWEFVRKKKMDDNSLNVFYSFMLEYIESFPSRLSAKEKEILMDRLWFVMERDKKLARLMIKKMDLNEESWQRALIAPLFAPYEAIIEGLLYKNALGKRGKWSLDKIRVVGELVQQGPYLGALNEKLKKIPRSQRYPYMKYFVKVPSRVWRKWWIKLDGNIEEVSWRYMVEEIGVDKKKAKAILENLSTHYPHLLLPSMVWLSQVAGEREWIGLALKLLSLPPEKYREIRKLTLEAPWLLRQEWEKEKVERIVYDPIDPQLKHLFPSLGIFKGKDPKERMKLLEGMKSQMSEELWRTLYQQLNTNIPGELNFRFTGEFDYIFRMGKGEKFNTCQAWDYPGHISLGLVGASLHGWSKLALLEKDGRILGRIRLHLAWLKGKYYVLKEEYYGAYELKHLLTTKVEELIKEWQKKGLIEGKVDHLPWEAKPAGLFIAPMYVDNPLGDINNYTLPRDRSFLSRLEEIM